MIENTLANRTNAKEFIFNNQDSKDTPPPKKDEVITPPSTPKKTPKKTVDESNLRTDGLLNAIYAAIKTINSKGSQQIYNSLVKTVIEGTNPNKLIAAKDNSGVHEAIANYFGNAFTNKGIYKEDDVVLFYPANVYVMSGTATLKSHFTYTPTNDGNTASFMSKEIRDAVKAGSTITMFPESSRISFDKYSGDNQTDYKSYTDYLFANGYEEIQNSKGKGTGVFIPVGSNRVIKPRVSKTGNEEVADTTPGLNLSELENLDFNKPTDTLNKVINAVKQVQDKILTGQLKVSNLNGWMAQVLRVMNIDNNLSNEDSAKFQRVIGQVRDYLKQQDSQEAASNTLKEAEIIYEQIGNKTESEHVVIKPIYQRAGVAYARSIGGVFSMRVNDMKMHFGNPYSHVAKQIAKGLIPTKDTKESAISIVTGKQIGRAHV